MRPDRTLQLATLGYEFISTEARTRGDVFDVSLLGRPVSCLTGPEAGALFYDEGLFERRTALPNLVKETLVGQRGVQTLDGAEHRARKALHLSLMTPDRVAELTALAAWAWQDALRRWTWGGRVVLFDEAAELLTRVACRWAGAPLPAAGAGELARALVAMVDGFATVGPRNWRGRWARDRVELWAQKVIRDVRAGRLTVPEYSAAYTFAQGTDHHGHPLRMPVAAVELLNVIRPTVAVCWYVAFAGHALHRHREWRDQLRVGDGDLDNFVWELRRWYPFTPFLGARVHREFAWRDHWFPAGRLTLLDVYGIDHDARIWPFPEVFAPERFRNREPGLYDYVPHGGGEAQTGHRCAGEDVTMQLVKQAVRLLVGLDYQVPAQDLNLRLNRIPARLGSGMVLERVRQAANSPVPEPV